MLRGVKSDRTPPGWALTIRFCEGINKALGTSLTPWDLENELSQEWFERLEIYLKKYKEAANG